MKMFPTLVILATLGTVSIHAQSAGPGVSYNNNSYGTSTHATGHDITGFTSRTGPGISREQANRPPNPNVVLRPKTGGVFVDGVKYGTVMISPTARAEFGIGERYLSAPNTRYDVDHESGPAAHRDAGGFKLFSLEF